MTDAETAEWIVHYGHRVVLGQKDDEYGDQPDRHHVYPLGEGGPNVAANRVTCTPNFHRACHELLGEYRRFGRKPPWEIRRTFPGARLGVPGVREIAALGWARMQRRAL